MKSPLHKMMLVLTLLLSCQIAFAQSRQISGKITDTKGESLIGASIAVKGTTTGTVTDADGEFTLAVTNEAVLVISYTGYTTKEEVVGTRTRIEITLDENINQLSETVVVGYGTQKKSQLTGAISSITAKQITELPITNARQALQGRAAGVDVVQAGSRPGSAPTVRIRGRRSIQASNEPLFVVDGIPLAGGIDDINPQDIQSMEILKDASATAIYGSRGSNGVVLVTTRRGKTGKSVVSFDTYYGISDALGKIDVMDGPQFAEYKRESRRAIGTYPAGPATAEADGKLFEPIELDGIAKNRSTDYQDYILRQGAIQSHQLGVTGGDKNTQFAISANYFNDKGIIHNQDFTRYTFRLNLDHQISARFKVGTSTLLVYSERNGEVFNPLGVTLRENPLGRPYDDNGNLIFLPTSDGLQTNPIAEIAPGAIIDLTKRTRMFSSLYGEWEIIPGLKYRVNFGPDFTNRRTGRFTGSQTQARRGGIAVANTSYEYGFNYTMENILNYSKSFGANNLNITAMQSLQKDDVETASISVDGVPVETQLFYALGQASTINNPGTGIAQWALNSYMGRVNYDFKGKYLLTLTGRYDGSSRFGRNTKYGFFPSAAIGWNISEEGFLKGSKWLEQLKLRASYGSVGNTGINPYQTQTSLSRTTYLFGTTGAYGYRPNVLGNPDLKWESTSTANIGLDFSLWAGRVYGTLEVYQADTRDLLLSDQLPLTSGFSSVLRNIGRTRNKGLEITLSTVNVDKGSFRWSTDLQFTHNKEAILELFNGKQDDIGNARFIGQPLTAYFDFNKIGIWQTSELDQATKYQRKPGEIKVEDVNGDGKHDASDRTILGSQVPDWSGGITNRFEYKGFDLSFFVFARVGSLIQSGFHSTFNTLAGRYNNLDIDYWTPNNPTNEFPRPNQNQEAPVYQSTLTYFSGTFVKIRNINFGYNVPTKKITGLRIFTSIQQPFIFSEYRSKYKGIDNETDGAVNQDQTPSVRQITFGINAKF
ncbi:SusC/RagA family TonB-linked outer membrane protein [Haliscomenobacter hydrossis]|uniref:TonB-dependent receptor plug n=1 Tax=Haliscomenobacter hydrossis (strain ATCC 27775 / DSM 1100 / LMG 10767 / O) TaxID=760192 RepID=F4KZ40_HALH1|nr:TonB-dependent receptor [Haliscomenobacter hydrossis]AEE53694.1 TonB-dependent receptor plug [Haliscomenobacter hydrossis DSM 1100]